MAELLLFDMDDTLLNSHKVVTKRTGNSICKASDNGVKIGYVTARSPRTVLSLLKGLPVDAVSYYGGVKTFCDDKCISTETMSNEEGTAIINGFRKIKPNGYLNVYFEPYSLKFNSLYKSWEPCSDNLENALAGKDIQRIIVRTSDIPLISDFITENMKTVDTRHGDTIIVHKKADKGNAARVIMSHFDIKAEETVAFGDDISDHAMFRACGTSVAMKNALYEIKSAACYVTDSCDNDGIAKWIEKHILSG